MLTSHLKRNAKTAWGVLCGHRAVHGCRGQNCAEAKRLRSIWAAWDLRHERAKIARMGECAYDGEKRVLNDGRCIMCGRLRAQARIDAAKWDREVRGGVRP